MQPMGPVVVTTVEQAQNGVLKLKGDLLFSTVVPLRKEILAWLERQSSRCVLDFTDTGRVDSSALALYLVCERAARRQGLDLCVKNLPADMASIAGLVGLDEVLHQLAE